MASRSTTVSSPPMLASGSRVVVVVSKGHFPAPPSAFVNVPDVLGEKQGDALSALQGIGSTAAVFNDYSSTYKRGQVMGQLPPSTVSVPNGTEAFLLVSSGPTGNETASVLLPDVVGKSEADAVVQLQNTGLSPQVVHDYSQNVPEGFVMAQLPNRDSLAAEVKGGKAWIWAVVAAVVVALAVAAFFLLQPPKMVTVPKVVGLTQAEAMKALGDAGLEASTTPAPKGTPGTVITQDPADGTEAKKGSVVVIGVVGPIETVTVPSVAGKTQADASKAITDAGFTVTTVNSDSDKVAKGSVVEQSPVGGTTAPKGSTVTLVISNGPPPAQNATVPNVVGMSNADAQKALTAAGLKVIVAKNPDATVPPDHVVAQLPSAGDSVAPGTSVGIVISNGPPLTPDVVKVPDVVGMKLADAKAAVTAVGLKVIAVPSTGSGKPDQEVVAQSPAADVEASAGSQVVLFYSAP